MSRDTALTVIEGAPPARVQNNPLQSVDPIPLLDTARFEQMQRVAQVMGSASLVPDALRFSREGSGDKAVLVPLPPATVVANCFLIVNQAVRWNMDPFAVAQCVSVISGKLCYEGKLIAAVLEAKIGVKLEYDFNDKEGDALSVTVTAVDEHNNVVVTSKGTPKAVTGTVGQWKTTRTGSPWLNTYPNHRRKMLGYRGAREWARVWEPGVMLGVYTDDEIDHLENAEVRSSRARDVTAVTTERTDKRLPPNPDAPPEQKAEAPKEPPAKEPPKAEKKKPTLPPNPDESAPPAAATDWQREGYLAHGRDLQRSSTPTGISVRDRNAWRQGWDNAAEDAAKLKEEQTERELDLDLLRSDFCDVIGAARSADNVEEAWKDYIEPVKDRLPPAVLRDLQRIKNNRMGDF